jgi:hypothetical protein
MTYAKEKSVSRGIKIFYRPDSFYEGMKQLSPTDVCNAAGKFGRRDGRMDV